MLVATRDIEGLDAPEGCNALEGSETNQRVLLHAGMCRRCREDLRR